MPTLRQRRHADSVNHADVDKGNSKASRSTGDVLSEMAPEAAVGAVAGAAQAVVPQNAKAKKGNGEKR